RVGGTAAVRHTSPRATSVSVPGRGTRRARGWRAVRGSLPHTGGGVRNRALRIVPMDHFHTTLRYYCPAHEGSARHVVIAVNAAPLTSVVFCTDASATTALADRGSCPPPPP